MADASAGDTEGGEGGGGGQGAGASPTPSPNPTPTENVTLVTSGLGDLATRATFLSGFIILGFMGNCVLVATIAQSTRLRKSPLNMCVISLAIVNLIDCIVNMPLILGSTISEKWDYGEIACQFNAAFITVTTMVMLLGLTLMALDRMLAVLEPSAYYERMTMSRINGFIVLTWLQSIIFSVPLVTKTIPVQPFSARYLCSVGNGADLLYIVMASLLGYILPLFVSVAFFVVIAKIVIREKLKDSNSNSGHAYNVDDTSEHGVWIEVKTSKYVLTLFVLWCILQGPYCLLNYVEQYRNSDEINSSIMFFTYPWELDLAFTWMKFSYATILPLVTFFWRKEIWQKFKNFILCRKSNLIKDASPHSSPGSRKRNVYGNNGNGTIERPATKRTDSQITGSLTKVPVLFATEDGLHFQTYGRKNSAEDENSDSEEYYQEPHNQTVSDIVTARKCDVYGSRDLAQIDDAPDTSDYDSHMDVDPFSTSNPISVRTEYERHSKASLNMKKMSHQNSVSYDNNSGSPGEPEGQVPPEVKNAFDSGIDSNPSTKEKGKKKKNKQKKETKVQEISTNQVEEEEEPEKYERNRTSSDSGRGSAEGSISHREKKRPPLKGSVLATIDTLADVEEPKVKKKKKKKKKKDGENDDSPVESGVVTAGTEKNTNAATSEHTEMTEMSRRPPPRLKPIDHKTEHVEMGPLRTPKILAPELTEINTQMGQTVQNDPHYSSNSVKSAIKSEAGISPKHDTEPKVNSLKPDKQHERSGSDVSEKRRKHRNSGGSADESVQRNNSDSGLNTDKSKKRPKSSTGKVGVINPEKPATNTAFEVVSSGNNVNKHKRRETSESQTALLGSGSSADMHSMKGFTSDTSVGDQTPTPSPASSLGKPKKKKKAGTQAEVPKTESQQFLIKEDPGTR